jgi:ATP phosphoribosyltransferase
LRHCLRSEIYDFALGPVWVVTSDGIEEKIVRDHPEIKALGAEGIIEYPLNKVVY